MPYPSLVSSGNNPQSQDGPWQIGSVLYAAFLDQFTSASEIWASSDAGITWAQVGIDGPNGNYVSAVVCHVLGGTVIYAINAPGSGSPNTIQVCAFDTITHTWSTSVDTTIEGDVADGNFPFEGLVASYRPDATIVVCGAPISTGIASYFIYDTVAQTTTAWLPMGDGSSTTGVVIRGVVRGVNRTHIFLINYTNLGGGQHSETLYQQTLEDNDTLEALQTVAIQTPDAIQPIGELLVSVAASNATGTVIAVAWLPKVGPVHVFKGASAATITFSAPQLVGSSAVAAYYLSYGSDGNLYLVYNDSTNTSYYEDTGSGFGSQVVLGAFNSSFMQSASMTLGFVVGIILDGSIYFWAFGGIAPPSPPFPAPIINFGAGGGGGGYTLILPEPSIRCGRLPTWKQLCKVVAPRGYPMLTTKMLLYQRGDSHGITGQHRATPHCD
jgi:hypothetical protein